MVAATVAGAMEVAELQLGQVLTAVQLDMAAVRAAERPASVAAAKAATLPRAARAMTVPVAQRPAALWGSAVQRARVAVQD